VILLRTREVDDRLRVFTDELARLSGLPIVYLVDERAGPVDTGDRAKISLTRERCAALGLYCPTDFAWRCGDYGFYLARHVYPDVEHFWMIENDVRIVGDDRDTFFCKFAGDPAALIAGYVGEPEADWPWRRTVVSRDAVPQKCFFPVVRLSAGAIDLLLAKRQRHSRIWARRTLWPNDEAFVATTLSAAGAVMRDLNDREPRVYRPDTFSFAPPWDGSLPLEAEKGGATLFHPVLFGEGLARKQRKLAERGGRGGLRGRIERKLHRTLSRERIAGVWCRGLDW